jgi:CheY-like chemotaxis protein
VTRPNPTPKVLYVEDEADLRHLLAQMLNLVGYRVKCAENGRTGVEKARAWLPDIILMDLRMPVMNGSDAIKILRSDPRTAHIPIVVMSAHTDANTRANCERIGANKFFAKPISIDKIDGTIRELLNNTSQVA